MVRARSVPFVARLVIALFAVLVALGSATATQRPQFRSTVELVQLQVGVTDSNGNFVRGLTAEDFVVVVEGEERPATVAYEIDLTDRSATGTAVIAATSGARPAARPVAARRHFLVFFDLRFTTRRGILEARESALEFVDSQVHPDDLVAVATADRFGIELVAPFTGNREQARLAIGTLGLEDAIDQETGGLLSNESLTQAIDELLASRGGDAGGLSQLPDIEFREYVASVSDYTLQMRELGRMLQAIEGRKHVLYFSRGFDDQAITGIGLNEMSQSAEQRAAGSMAAYAQGAESTFGSAEIRENLDELIGAFRGADAVVHAIDPTGLAAIGDPTAMGSPAGSRGAANPAAPRLGSSRQSLVALSDATGGSAHWNLNSLTTALAEVEAATATYYMIAYRKAPTDPPTVDLRVRVLDPAASTVSAPTRLTPPPAYRAMNDAQRQLQLAEFLNDDVNRSEIDLRANVVAFPTQGIEARAMVVLEINGGELERLAEERGEERVELEIGGFAIDHDNRVLDSFRRGVTVDVAAMRAAGPMFAQSFRFSEYVDVPPGDLRVRLLVRERAIGRLSSTTRSFNAVAVARGMRVMPPMIVADAVAAVEEDDTRFDPMAFGDRRLVPVASSELVPGRPFLVLIVAYGLPRDPTSGEVLARIGLEIEEDLGGALTYALDDFEIVGSSHDERADATRLLVRATVPTVVRPGGAGLWAHVREEVTGESLSQPADVMIVRPLASGS